MKRPKVALALGAGASRGLAHIGVIKGLIENNIPIDMVAGTSAGALVGALYCCGVDIKVMEQIARGIPMKNLLDLSVPKIGFVKGGKIESLIKLLTKNMRIEDLKIPFRAVATNLTSGEKLVFDKGLIYKAVRASISIPGVFTPIYMDDNVLVDGCILERVPVSTARDMGADIVIGVDVGFSSLKGKTSSIFDVIFKSIDLMQKELLKTQIIDADFLIKPYLKDIDPTRFDQVDECSNEAYEVTKEAIPVIKDIIESKICKTA
ncbi:NTE family protein RssA [Oxobacter pfennigii]|uniref:NTE family protein RssA n=1 Tax=Oxobacter pfennigii TaxID=36849 RepID=A0A0P8YW74_9CLOT|nr:patatin-like phospholipase family protein [Oxobacter pfennigii]KPU43959.1 NTE family protein RssA [Oxobacter pfennigii]